MKTDFELFVDEIGLTAEQLERAKTLAIFVSPTALEQLRVVLAKSPIEGMGIFALVDIPSNQIIAPAFNAGVWSHTGRYLNHSSAPNVRCARAQSVTMFESIRAIARGEELTVDYRNVKEMVSQ